VGNAGGTGLARFVVSLKGAFFFVCVSLCLSLRVSSPRASKVLQDFPVLPFVRAVWQLFFCLVFFFIPNISESRIYISSSFFTLETLTQSSLALWLPQEIINEPPNVFEHRLLPWELINDELYVIYMFWKCLTVPHLERLTLCATGELRCRLNQW